MIFRFIKEQRYFFIPYFIFIVIGVTLVFNENKIDLHLYLTKAYSDFADDFFFWLTKLAEGWLGVPLLIFLLFYQYRAFLFVGLTYALSGIITQVLKANVFQTHDRPIHFLKDHPLFRKIENLEYSEFLGFPSGHSTSAFALLFCMSILTKNNYLKLVLILTAIAIAYSRIYLSQHFLHDIIAGSFVGVGTGLLLYFFIYEKKILFSSDKFEGKLKF
ncbi:MAG: phosphatase PAP2 family protein [Flavobacteriales bacterium]